MRQSNPRTIHALLSDQPKTRQQLSEESGLNKQQVRFAIRGMVQYGQAIETPEGVIKGPNGFRKQWASKKEKQRHYAKQYRLRAQKDTGEMGRKYRETQKRNEAKRVRDITRKVAVDNARKRAKADNAQREKASVLQAAKKRIVDSLATLPAANDDRMTVEEWMALGGVVERLPSNLGQAYAGLNANRIMLY